MNRWTRRSIILGCLALLNACAMPALAVDYYWTNNAGGNFTDAGNWSPSGPPGAADNANFTNNTSYTLTNTSSVANNNAYYNAPGGTVTHNIGAGYTWALTNRFIVGQMQESTATVVKADSGTLAVTNADGTAELKVGETGQGTFTLSAGTVTADRLIVTNNTASSSKSTFIFGSAGTLNTLKGSTLVLQSGQKLSLRGVWNIQDGTNIISATSGGLVEMTNTATVVVSGAGAVWTNTQPLRVGYDSSNNRLIVTNGAKVYSAAGSYIGYWVSENGNNNEATIVGTGSLWNAGDVTIGRSGWSNRLRVLDGGTFIGRHGGPYWADGCSVLVSGEGAVLTNSSGTSEMPSRGTYNSLTIQNGGKAYYANLTIHGQPNGAPGDPTGYNTLLVTGTGSILTVTSQLEIGMRGSANTMTIINSAQAFTGNGYLGGNGWDGLYNKAVVTGSGSIWSNAGVLSVGYSGWYCGLTVTNGGLMVNGGNAYLGYAGSGGNTAAVTGAGSLLRVGGYLYVGNSGIKNQLTVTNNGRVVAGGLVAGANASSTGNVIVVSGGSLIVSNASASALLEVRSGTLTLSANSNGTVWCGDLVVTNSSSNILRFEMDGQTGVGAITVTNQFSVTNALLQVAATTRGLMRANVVLATYRTRIGSFASTNVTVTVDKGTAWVEQTDTNIVLHLLPIPKGTIVGGS